MEENLSALLTERANPASAGLDTLPTLEMLRVFNREDKLVAEAVERELPQVARAVEAVAAVLEGGGRLFYIGAGTSGRLGVLDASECPPTFNVASDVVTGVIAGGDGALRQAAEASEDDEESGARDLLANGFQARDAVVGIAASGRTPYVLGAVKAARRMGALTVGLCCVADSALSRTVEIGIAPLVGPEVITGSTRLKAGTATKLVLNMLSTAVMVRLGFVYSNLMINVQPRNEKLMDRARRIVEAIVGCDAAQAAGLLESSGRSVKTAVVMGKLGAGREEAERRLAAAGGRVRRAMDAN